VPCAITQSRFDVRVMSSVRSEAAHGVEGSWTHYLQLPRRLFGQLPIPLQLGVRDDGLRGGLQVRHGVESPASPLPLLPSDILRLRREHGSFWEVVPYDSRGRGDPPGSTRDVSLRGDLKLLAEAARHLLLAFISLLHCRIKSPDIFSIFGRAPLHFRLAFLQFSIAVSSVVESLPNVALVGGVRASLFFVLEIDLHQQQQGFHLLAGPCNLDDALLLLSMMPSLFPAPPANFRF